MATTAAKPEVFSRKASGLSRVMSPGSAFMYNFLTMGVIFPWTILWAPAAFPGVSVWKACLFAILLELPIALAYVWMATAMPRSGGDYVFQSRVLGGSIGFPVVMSGFVIWIVQWVALAGWLLAVLGVAPLFMGLGVYYDSASLINAAVWCQSPQGKVIISIVGAAAMAALLIAGFKHYVRLQYFMFAGTAILVVVLLVQFLRTSPAQFATAMNHFSNVVDGRVDYYHWIQKDITDAGVSLLPKFALGATLLAVPIVWTSLQWATYSVEQGGEIKGARVFKNQMFIIVGSMIAMGVTLALLAWAQERAVGTAFFNAVSNSYFGYSASGEGLGSVYPLPGMFAIVISPNPIITILVSICFILAALQITCNCYIGMTRVMVGMSLDRTLPAWLSKVSPRYRSPVNHGAPHLLLGGVRRDLRLQLLGLVVQPHPGRDIRLRLRLRDQLSRSRAHAVSRQGTVRRVAGRPVHSWRLSARHHLRHHRLHRRLGCLDRLPHERGLRPQGHAAVCHRRQHLRDLPGRLLDRPGVQQEQGHRRQLRLPRGAA
jgi:APA family basic amino acid/polyamine antiporter